MRRKTRMRVADGHRATVAHLDYMDENGFTLTFIGDAKRHPKDTDVPLIGEYYAMSRAFMEASKAFEEFADHMVAEHAGKEEGS